MTILPLVLLIGGAGLLVFIVVVMVSCHRHDRRVLARATELLRHGDSSRQAQQQLVAEGADPKETAKAVRQAMEAAAAAAAVEMLHRGMPEAEARKRLAASGMDPVAAAGMVRDVAHPAWARRHPVLGVMVALALLTTIVMLAVSNTQGRVNHDPVGLSVSGEAILHLGKDGSQEVGYKYGYQAVFCLDVWTWGGTYCVYQRFDRKYRPISPAEAARLLAVSESQLHPPFWYRYPPGLFIFGPWCLIGAVAWVRQQQAKLAADEAAKLLQDARYQGALQIARGGGPNPRGAGLPTPGPEAGAPVAALGANQTGAAGDAAIQALGSLGVDRAAAEQGQALGVWLKVTCPKCGLPHAAGTRACSCGQPLTGP